MTETPVGSRTDMPPFIQDNFKPLFKGKTGFPWIDAIMTQLRQEGWIHHLARHAVACFLTRGDLWISWEEGMKVSPLVLWSQNN